MLIRINAITAAISNAPDTAALLLERAELYRQDHNWTAAAHDLDQATRLDPQLATIDFFRGRLLASEDKPTEARDAFSRYLERRPDDGTCYIERARALVRLADRTNAIADFSRGLKLLPQPPADVFIERAQAFLDDKRDAEALRSLDEAIQRLGPLVTLQALALEIEVRQGEHAAALARLELITPQVPRRETWLARRGEIELLAGRPADARLSFEGALGALRQLPPRLQQTPHAVALRTRVESALKEI